MLLLLLMLLMMMMMMMMILMCCCTEVDVSKCTVSGRGIQPRGLRVNEPAVFHVNTLNAGPSDLDVTVSSTAPAATPLPVTVDKVGILFLACLTGGGLA